MTVFKARLIVIAGTCILFSGLIAGRLFEIQILNGKKFAAESRKQTKQRAVVDARRGSIFDRFGNPLATSIAADTPSKHRHSRGDESDDKSLADRGRWYPHGKLAGSVLGYVGTDGYGLGGVEYAFDQVLRGENGWSILQKDGINNRYARIDMPQRPPIGGSDVYLSLDLNIQKIVETVLHQTVSEMSAKSASCIVIDPLSGDILAMANEPVFDPNRASDYGLEQRVNGCISYNYEPGSTFKVVPAASALEEKVMGLADTIDGNRGVYEIYDQSIRDHKPYGRLSFVEALSYSSNVCFAKIADKVGSANLYRYTKDFGLGSESGVELPGEECGIVHPLERWSGRTRVTMAIGQEVSVTLLQMVLVFGAIANDGVLLSPRICKKIVDPAGGVKTVREPRQVRRVVSRQTARYLRSMLASVVASGTGRLAAIPGVSVAGKTGTSQKFDRETGEYSLQRVWASFIGFAPAEEPVLLCGVVVDEPSNGDVGGVAAAPAFRKILSQIISHPDLEFAERILDSSRTDSSRSRPGPGRLPDVCGMECSKAMELLRAERIDFELIGTGTLVRNQSPEPGRLFNADARLILYTSDGERAGPNVVSMPNCVGKDLRDAINAVNTKGLKPYVFGAGAVRKQCPTAGVVLQSSDVCTLYCSLDG